MEVTQKDCRGSFYEWCVFMCVCGRGCGGDGGDVLEQWFPTSSAPGTSLPWAGVRGVWDDSSTLQFLCTLFLT